MSVAMSLLVLAQVYIRGSPSSIIKTFYASITTAQHYQDHDLSPLPLDLPESQVPAMSEVRASQPAPISIEPRQYLRLPPSTVGSAHAPHRSYTLAHSASSSCRRVEAFLTGFIGPPSCHCFAGCIYIFPPQQRLSKKL